MFQHYRWTALSSAVQVDAIAAEINQFTRRGIETQIAGLTYPLVDESERGENEQERNFRP